MPRDDARPDYFLTTRPHWIRVAVEFRHDSWLCEAVFGILDRTAPRTALSGANLPCVLRATAPFVYVRMHGPDHEHLYGGSYPEAGLDWWAERIRDWQGTGRDVFVYFNNDGDGNAVRNASGLASRFGS